MSSPFPGMDPFLEMQPFWSDFVPSFLTSMSNTLLAELLPRYDVRFEEYKVAIADPALNRIDVPDIESPTQRRLRIIHREDGQVVTVIELLSPSNKVSGEDGIEAYLQKRTELIASHVNLVEIDLLRGGERLPMREPLPAADYFVYVGRPNRRPRCQLVCWPLSKPLPKIQIPLLPEDGDAELDLGEVFRSAYEPALYDRRLSYDQALKPKPSESDQEWISGCLAKRKA